MQTTFVFLPRFLGCQRGLPYIAAVLATTSMQSCGGGGSDDTNCSCAPAWVALLIYSAAALETTTVVHSVIAARCVFIAEGQRISYFCFPFFLRERIDFLLVYPTPLLLLQQDFLRKYDQDRVGVRTREPAAYGGVVSLVVCRTVAVDSLEGRV